MAIPKTKDSNGNLTKSVPFFANGTDGWFSFPTTLTYDTHDSSTATNGTMYTVKLNTGADVTQSLDLGWRFKFLHDSVIKYGIVVAKDATSITLLLKLNTSVLDGTKPVGNIYFSSAKCPVGFSVNSNDWKLYYTSSTYAPYEVADTNWHEISTSSILSILQGVWDLRYRVKYLFTAAAGVEIAGYVTLSSASATESDTALTTSIHGLAGWASQTFETINKGLNLTTKTTYHINCKQSTPAGAIYVRNQDTPCILEATCAYL